jgi:aromatic ring-opening dioxygenase catalytic subunit (LigB family)
VVSGHWEEPVFTASAAAQPRLIFDYSGFPEHTYRLTWPAPGDPELAERVAGLLSQAGLPAGLNANRGFDHGVFVPLKVAFPEAKIPVVTLSLAASLDPALHLAAGRALAPLRDEGVLIVGSGMSFHNLRAYLRPETAERARAFDSWLTRAVESPATERSALLTGWREAPFAAFAHPREEHLIPLMVAAGAGGDAPGTRIFGDEPMGAAISAYRFG